MFLGVADADPLGGDGAGRERRQQMIRLTVDVFGDDAEIIGAKEDICMMLEKYGNAKVIRVEPVEPEQLSFGKKRGQ